MIIHPCLVTQIFLNFAHHSILRTLLKLDDHHLAISDLTNDIIGDDVDQAQNRAFSTNVIWASKKLLKVCLIEYNF
jgi:hypothetical protein